MCLEFCPKCFHPLEPTQDESEAERLCEVCSWFGDKSEVCLDPPTPTVNEKAFLTVVDLYRDICHMEYHAAQLIEAFPEHKKKLEYIQRRVEHSRHSLLYMFRANKQ